MMDKKMIQDNGLLELYLLGELNKAEQIQIQHALNSDTSLKADFEKLEASFESMALENAISPPKQVRDQLLSKVSQTKVVPIQNTKSNKAYLAIAASIAGFLLLSTIWLYSQFNTVKTELQTVQQQNSTLLNDIENLTNDLEYTTQWFNVINSPDSEQYILTGNTLSPNSKVVSYVNHTNKTVVINTEKLAKLDDDKDYQMWADVEGVMIDMGVIPKSQALTAMTYIENAESINITIEPAGGNDHPTVSQLISNVYLD